MENCYNEGNIKNSANQAGGIVGSISGGFNINLCFNSGYVEGYTSAGGITGFIGWSTNGIITNCYNIGDINANSSIGGISGNLTYGNITNCYNIGHVYYNNNSKAMGIVGSRHSSPPISDCDQIITNCYYLSDIADHGINTGDTGEDIHSKSASDMKTQAFVDLLNENGKENNWKIVEGKNNGYPILSWE